MSKFQPITFYSQASTGNYHLLPLRFHSKSDGRTILTNLVGEYHVAPRETFEKLVSRKLTAEDPDYLDLKSKHFFFEETDKVSLDLLALKLRTKVSNLSQFTSLHIFVVTLRCEHSCPYCQVSRQSEDKGAFDMTEALAEASLDLVFKSPSPAIKIEFQGGEPLLNFGLIKHIVKLAKSRNEHFKKNLDFVIATNLALIDQDVLQFCKDNGVHISTSLDGPEDLHNKNRPRPGRNSYEKTIEGINKARLELGRDQVSALMTTTEASLSRVKEIIDEYLRQGFQGIFLRHLSPYGFAIKTKSFASYSTDRWLNFYEDGLLYIIELNKAGIKFQEYYASTILKRILTSQEPGYVDLMSPAGIGIAAVVYNYDGSVHPSDESRMLAEMGDNTFRLGHVSDNTYEEIFSSNSLLEPLEESFTGSVPMCNDCAFEPYCGADPVYHHAIHKDFVGRKPDSEFCKRNMTIFKLLIDLMERDSYCRTLFMEWANRA